MCERLTTDYPSQVYRDAGDEYLDYMWDLCLDCFSEEECRLQLA